MKKKFTISGVMRNTMIGSVMWLLGQTAAVACDNLFYVIWAEAEATTNIYVRHVLVEASGTSDLYGLMEVPDDALGGSNPSYINNMAVNAFMHNTKVRIFTDDTDCDISSNGELLGTVSDIEVADLF